MTFIKIDPKELGENPFKMLDDRWALITAGDKTGFNTMTASWGGLGVLWHMNVATCYVRPQRHTHEFIQNSDHFTLSFFTEDYRAALKLCGSKSGKDTDKVKECGFTVAEAASGGIYFEQANLVIACKKLYTDRFDPRGFNDDRIAACYSPDDYHYLYIGEIVEILKAE